MCIIAQSPDRSQYCGWSKSRINSLYFTQKQFPKAYRSTYKKESSGTRAHNLKADDYRRLLAINIPAGCRLQAMDSSTS
jgi:hypothetical protein